MSDSTSTLLLKSMLGVGTSPNSAPPDVGKSAVKASSSLASDKTPSGSSSCVGVHVSGDNRDDKSSDKNVHVDKKSDAKKRGEELRRKHEERLKKGNKTKSVNKTVNKTINKTILTKGMDIKQGKGRDGTVGVMRGLRG